MEKRHITVKLKLCFMIFISLLLIIGTYVITLLVGWGVKAMVNKLEQTQNLQTLAIATTVGNLVEADLKQNKTRINPKRPKMLSNETLKIISMMSGSKENAIIEDVIITYNANDNDIKLDNSEVNDIVNTNESDKEEKTGDLVLFDYKNPVLVGQVINKDVIANKIQKQVSIDFTNIYYDVTLVKGEMVRETDTMGALVKTLQDNFVYIILIIIVVSILMGHFMSALVSNSLERLADAADKMAQRKFDKEIPQSHFSEINKLINAYNKMGVQLNDLYSSLEQKVQQRTVALEEANSKLKETQAMMVHSEKMRSLGELVAGIAHEINNPVNFIHGNIMILQNYADDLLRLIDAYDKDSESLTEEQRKEIDNLRKEIDLDFLRDDIKELIRSCVEGTERTKNIVLDLKNFSRMEEMVLTHLDVPKEIDTTLNILNNKYKNRITVEKNYDPGVPRISAYGGQLNQVFMNILDNAQDAIEGNGKVTINVKKDEKDSGKIKLEFIDTGVGIPEENLKKVFDPFFTTKAVGKGTGLGMSISYRVIKDHGGTIDVESKVGEGTKFTIRLPIEHENNKSDNDKEIIV